MNILYISRAKGVPWAGPTYSIPAQIAAQRNYDDILWYNIIKPDEPYAKEWFGKTGWRDKEYYCDLIDYPNQKISELPQPFCKPDLIVVEQFYGYAGYPIIREIMRSGIPYIIIPRGELTDAAQKSKRLKKWIGNILIFKKFAKNAASIEYLTEQEYKDSGTDWNENKLIIPNGMESSKQKACGNNKESGYKFLSIGRLDPYHKGLDLLISACSLVQEQLRNNNCSIIVYGPDRVGKLADLVEETKLAHIDDLLSFGGPLYGEEKKKVMLSSDIFVITSRFEGHPMALIEAMDYGLPCIATTGCNMRSEIEQYKAGWTADCTTESIADAFCNAIQQLTKLESFSNNAIHLASEYEWDKLAEYSHKQYEELLNK